MENPWKIHEKAIEFHDKPWKSMNIGLASRPPEAHEVCEDGHLLEAARLRGALGQAGGASLCASDAADRQPIRLRQREGHQGRYVS